MAPPSPGKRTAQVGAGSDEIQAMPAHSSLLVFCIPPLPTRPRAGAVLSRQWLFGLSMLLLAWLAAAPAPLRALAPLLNAASELDDAGKLLEVNQFFNRRIRFREDSAAWGQADHWASPLELLAKGEGDCEDFAIAKYFALRALGVPSSRLRLVYVQALKAGPPRQVQPHMVLAYYAKPGAAPSILDNLVPEVLPAELRSDLTPVFSFNLDGLWQGLGNQSAGNPMARLPRWRETLAKAHAEGFP